MLSNKAQTNLTIINRRKRIKNKICINKHKKI